MSRDKLNNLLQKEMSRKDFLSFTALAFVSLFGVAGVITELLSHAATPYASTEAEAGKLSNSAQLTTNDLASDDSAVQFGTTATTTHTVKLGIYPADPTMLVAFQGFNATIAPRSLDYLMFFSVFGVDPIYFSGYPSWCTELNAAMYVSMDPKTTLGSFASGSQDTYLTAQANSAKSYGKPIVLRICHEFNLSGGAFGQGAETAASFISGWQHVYTLFHALEATNVQFLWSANYWQSNDSSTIDPSSFYPGDAYVDIVGLDGYETVRQPQTQPRDIYLSNYTTLTTLSPKPFWLSEFGCAEDPRLAATGGKAGWYEALFSLIATDMPRCECACQWQQDDGTTGDFTISSSGSDMAAQAAFVTGVNTVPFA